MRPLNVIVVASLLAMGLNVVAGCRTDSGSALHEGETTVEPVLPDINITQLKTMTLEEWQTLFANGQATDALIPSRESPGVTYKGAGYPRIFNTLPQLNLVANKIWNGKNFITEDGVTMLKNQFVQDTGTSAVQLFDAKVVVDGQSRLNDGKPVILLDYSVSGVPGIKAIRDEVRLVSKKIQQVEDADGIHFECRYLYLGPTFLVPANLNSLVSAWAKPWEFKPVLWFALEFTPPCGP